MAPPSGRICPVDWGILEREPELARLATAAQEAADGAGSVALVFGEAGIGKSSLVKAMPDRLPGGARVLVGQCDDLATRRPLGPFRDLIGSIGAELAQAVMEGVDRHRVYEALQGSWPGYRIRPCSSSRTSTGPTRRHWTPCGFWYAEWSGCPHSSYSPTATTS